MVNVGFEVSKFANHCLLFESICNSTVDYESLKQNLYNYYINVIDKISSSGYLIKYPFRRRGLYGIVDYSYDFALEVIREYEMGET